jgi:Tfp pilus assembly protein PilO
MDVINEFLNNNLGDNYVGITIGILAILILIIIGFFADRASHKEHKANKKAEQANIIEEFKQKADEINNSNQQIESEVNNQSENNNYDMSNGLEMENTPEPFEKTEVISQQPFSINMDDLTK